MEEFTALHTRSCVALTPEGAPCDTKQALVYQKQVMDWKIRVVDGREVLRREFRTENPANAEEVVTRFTSVAEAEGQTLDAFVKGRACASSCAVKPSRVCTPTTSCSPLSWTEWTSRMSS